MSDNKNLPAFPATVQYNEKGDPIGYQNGSSTGQEIGITKLEFFACNAPFNIPDWFEHIAPECTLSEMYKPDAIENEEDRREVKGWIRDPIFDLPDHLKWFSDRVELIRQEMKVFEAKNAEARYFQWCRYYAEQLLVELSKS